MTTHFTGSVVSDKVVTAEVDITQDDSTGDTDLSVDPTAKSSGNLLFVGIGGVQKFAVNTTGTVSLTNGAPILVDGVQPYTAQGPVTTGALVYSSPGKIASKVQGTHSETSGINGAVSVNPVYNQASGSAINYDHRVARTETAVGSGDQRLYTGGLGGEATYAERWGIDNAGQEIQTADFGGQFVRGFYTEEVTLSPVALITDSVEDLLPSDAVIESVSARLTANITNATDWAVGDAATAARFISAQTGLTAGVTAVGIEHTDQTGAAGPKQSFAAKVRITCTGSQPDSGAVRITVWYRRCVADST